MKTISAVADSILANLPIETDEQRADRKRREAEASECQLQAEKIARWRKLVSEVGRRYEHCRLSTFEVTCGLQQAVIQELADFATNIGEAIAAGRNIVLYGPRGTGKDHLLVAMLRVVIEDGWTVDWRDGQELFGECRDGIDSARSEVDYFSRFDRPNVFAISDPTPPIGDLRSEWQLANLFRIIDRRYRDMKPTWVTINAANAEEAAKRIAPNIIDRLTHGALVLRCNWRSFRSGK